MQKKPVVLVVDDSLTVRTILAHTLSGDAFTLVFVSDGLSALSAIADLSPVVLLLDVQLPHMDGYTICQLLRKNVLYKALPIVLLTSKNKIVDRIYGRLVGATEYLTKPFDPEELTRIIQKYVARGYEYFLPYAEVQSSVGRFWKRQIS
jgi:twitching motility two-component system response regulator PilG